MGIEDRIKDEMFVSTESILENQMDRAKKLFTLHDSGSIAVKPAYADSNLKEQLLIHLIGQQYLYYANETDSAALLNEYFYQLFDKDESTIRHHFTDLQDDGLVKSVHSNGRGRELVVEQLESALNQIGVTNED